jgi:anthranilate phosphoribosyltransferase
MFQALIEKLTRHEDLTSDEAAAAMTEVMEGRAAASHIAGLLIGLAMKGERPAEIVGLARTMRAHAVHVSKRYDDLFDTCGTGGDRSDTFNISSCAALVVAACGVHVAKHGNRSASSRTGGADVYEALGIRVTAPPAVVERCLADAGIGFFFAPTFHPSMRHAGPVRRELGVRTAFNLLGPLTNPAGATRQLVGVPRPEFTELLARSLMLLGTTRAWVVHGADGIDELTTTGYTKDLGVPRRRRQHVLSASGRRRPAEGGARIAAGRRRAPQRPDHRRHPRRRARAGARRRAVERRGRAVHRRRRVVGRRWDSESVAGDRSRRRQATLADLVALSTAEEFGAGA